MNGVCLRFLCRGTHATHVFWDCGGEYGWVFGGACCGETLRLGMYIYAYMLLQPVKYATSHIPISA